MKLAPILLVLAVALLAVSLLPVRETDHPGFASPAFQRVWSADSASAARPIDVWGSDPLIWRTEPYSGAPDDRRTVQYFERGRMEIEVGTSVVTMGRLALEMVSGEIDLGSGLIQYRPSPDVSIDGGPLDDQVPTYLTLARLTGLRDPGLAGPGQRVNAWVNRAGLFEYQSAPAVIRLGSVVHPTGYALPEVTEALFARSEFAEGRWIELFGYPVSEPFWSYYRRDEQLRPSMIQVFERRVLVYSPQMENERRFTVANTGRHYYRWRYGTELTAEQIADTSVESVSGIGLPEGYQAAIYDTVDGRPIDLALSASGHLMVLTMDGRILRASSLDPTGVSTGWEVWAEGIEDPIEFTVDGFTVGVRTANDIVILMDSEESDAESVGGSRGQESLFFDHNSRLVSDVSGNQFHVETSETTELFRVDTGELITVQDEHIARPGPAMFTRDWLYLSGVNEEGHAVIVRRDTNDLSEPPEEGNVVFFFEQGTKIRSMERGSRSSWPKLDQNSLLVAVQNDGRGSIYLLSESDQDGATELVEFATGLAQPAALVLALDGSLFVADADRNQILRISYSGP